MKPLAPDAARAVVPRLAATVLILRDGATGPEVLMVKRSMQASFMPGAYVFPGGAVDEADGQARCEESATELAERVGRVTEVGERGAAFTVAALRECFEEAGLWLGIDHPPGDLKALRARLHGGESFGHLAHEAGLPLATRSLIPWSHWVTPMGLPKRFDTLFFVCRAPAGQHPEVDAGETTTLEWIAPKAAIAASKAGTFQMEFATLSTVRSLVPFAERDVQALLDHAAAQRALPPLHPRLKVGEDGHTKGVALPGDPGYDALFGDGPQAG